MGQAIAYFLTWTTYGTWLPGDSRGWIDRHDHQVKQADSQRETKARKRMQEQPLRLSDRQIQVVEDAIYETSSVRGWKIHAIAVHTNHVHVAISVTNKKPKHVLRILKAYSTRALKQHVGNNHRQHWWTRSGSIRCLFRTTELRPVIEYIENQGQH